MREWKKAGFIISTNKDRLDIEFIHWFLSEESYWAKDRRLEDVRKSIQNTSLCFGVYKENTKEQVGFARVITDLTTFAYLADVFIVAPYRGIGLSKWLLHVITEYPDLKDIKRMLLITADAHDLYAKYGFNSLDMPQKWMQKVRNDL